MPKITDITRQKKNRQRFSVFVDDRYAFACGEAEFVELAIAVGDQISEARLQEITGSVQQSRLRRSALAYLARRSRSVGEMRTYLRRKGAGSETTDEIIAWLSDCGYLNDDDFAEQWVRWRLRVSPRARRVLLAELKEKGIDAARAIEAVDRHLPPEDEAQVAFDLLQQRKKRWVGQERLEIKRKVFNFLRYRGFSGAIAYEAGNRLLEEMIESSGD